MKVEFRQFHGPSDWGLVQEHLPLKRVEDTMGIVAVDTETNTTVGICVLDTWTHTSVQAHLIVLNSMLLRHGFLEEVTDYVYNVADREVMIGLVPSNNEKALALDKHIGFTEVARIRDAVMFGVDMVILEMRKDDCRWLTPLPVAATGD